RRKNRCKPLGNALRWEWPGARPRPRSLPTMHTGPILALDLGKFKSVACVYPPGGGSPTFDTVPASREALLALLQLRRPAVVVLEACVSAGWVHDLCAGRQRQRAAEAAGRAWE
ncbi:MAG: hypothetical protein U0840_16950, partial [Gemmataceae bacterium]